jgi:radical SAM superfamily enzyme YgiQ (UPF0313 family)
MKKIILFNPRPSKKPGYRGLPLSLLSLSSLLKKKYEIKIVNALVNSNYCETVASLIDDNTVCVGITAMTGYPIKEGINVARIVKEESSIPVVWGGWHPTILPEQTVSSEYADIVVRGHGEVVFYDLVNSLANKKSFKTIPNISYENNGKIISNPTCPPENINNIPPLPYELVNVEELVSKEIGEKTINYNSSYGCPYNCGFCCEKLMTHRKWSALEPKRVVKDFEILHEKYGIDGIRLEDTNFFVSEKRVVEICKKLIEKKMRLKWGHVNGRVDQLLKYKKTTWKLLEKSGCTSLLIGAESGSQVILDFINKQTKADDILKISKLCEQHNIQGWYSFMFGFPGQNHDDEIEKTIKLIENIHSTTTNSLFLWFFFTPYPGTDLYKICLDYGIEEPQSLEEWSEWEFLTQKVPWISKTHERIINQFMSYIFPSIQGGRVKFKNIYSMLKPFAMTRLRHKFFAVPIEYWILRSMRKIYKGVKK